MSGEEPDTELLEKAMESSSLQTRIDKNEQAQELDFIGWIFNHLEIKPGDTVLELGCGTGAQTIEFLDRVGEEGQVVAVDVSAESLETLKDSVDDDQQTTLTTIQADMMDLESALTEAGVDDTEFDTVFCAYGLYYADDPIEVLESVTEFLATDGSITVVGPFGSNNGPWFTLLSEVGVELPEFVRYSSSTFMTETVVPWAAENFEQLAVETAVNHIERTSADELFEYWESSTYFDPDHAEAVQAMLNDYFETTDRLVNRKWIMHLTMRTQREIDAILEWKFD
jgi:ubiquinone/menaquinone biosynthesis C-methylase UbiE